MFKRFVTHMEIRYNSTWSQSSRPVKGWLWPLPQKIWSSNELNQTEPTVKSRPRPTTSSLHFPGLEEKGVFFFWRWFPFVLYFTCLYVKSVLGSGQYCALTIHTQENITTIYIYYYEQCRDDYQYVERCMKAVSTHRAIYKFWHLCKMWGTSTDVCCVNE